MMLAFLKRKTWTLLILCGTGYQIGLDPNKTKQLLITAPIELLTRHIADKWFLGNRFEVSPTAATVVPKQK